MSFITHKAAGLKGVGQAGISRRRTQWKLKKNNKKNMKKKERYFSCEIKMSGLSARGLVTSEDTFGHMLQVVRPVL